MEKRSVLITGCSAGGVGSGLALEFQSRGFLVFATARDLTKVSHLKDAGCEIIRLDVCEDESIFAAKAIVEEQVRGRGLDFLINNAAITHLGPLLDTPPTLVRNLMNTNIVGSIVMCQAFFPLLRTAKGAVIHIGSVSQWTVSAYAGLYGGSKAAFDILTHQLRMEFSPFGVDVVLITAGVLDTSLQKTDKSVNGMPASSPDSLYHPIADMIATVDAPFYYKAQPPNVFARKVCKKIGVGLGREATRKKRRPARVYEGSWVWAFWIGSAIIWCFVGIFGIRTWDFLTERASGIRKLKKIVKEEEAAERGQENTTISKGQEP